MSGIGGASGVLAESCGPLPDLGAAAPRLGSFTYSLPSGVHRSPRKARLVASLRSPLGAACRLAVSASLRLVALRTACCASWVRVRQMDLARALI